MTFEQLCEAVRLYVESVPTEPTRGRDDDWRDRLDSVLTELRLTLATAHDQPNSEA